jgi:hypothetical protein
MVGAKPYGHLQYRDVNGKRMAYVDEGEALSWFLFFPTFSGLSGP